MIFFPQSNEPPGTIISLLFDGRLLNKNSHSQKIATRDSLQKLKLFFFVLMHIKFVGFACNSAKCKTLGSQWQYCNKFHLCMFYQCVGFFVCAVFKILGISIWGDNKTFVREDLIRKISNFLSYLEYFFYSEMKMESI